MIYTLSMAVFLMCKHKLHHMAKDSEPTMFRQYILLFAYCGILTTLNRLTLALPIRACGQIFPETCAVPYI